MTTNVHKIVLDKILKLINLRINELIKDRDHSQLEVEARFRLFSSHEPYVKQSYYRLQSYLIESNYRYTVESYETHSAERIEIKEGELTIRRRIDLGNIELESPLSSDQILNTTWIRKIELGDEKLIEHNNNLITDYNINIATSVEEILTTAPKNFIAVKTRRIQRYSFDFTENTRIDLSKVRSNGKIFYEFELELIHKDKLSEFSEDIVIFFKILHDTIEIYTSVIRRNIFTLVNNHLGIIPRDFITSDLIFKPRDLRYDDLIGRVWLNNQMRVSYKTDGIHKLLVIVPNGIWLIIGSTLNYIQYQSKKQGNVSILDGEFVPKKNRTNKISIFYVVFDALVVNNDDVRQLTHKERLIRANKYKVINDSTIYVEYKDFHDFETADDFFNIMNKLEKSKKFVGYDVDGYIFVTNEMPYNSRVDSCPPYERTLLRHPDICKWKPTNQLTIDFSVLKVDNKFSLRVYDMDSGKRERFEHTKLTKLQGNYASVPDDTIIEFRYENGEWIPMRIRYDRNGPNGKSEALAVWNMIRDPIQIETLTGNSLILMRKYHNREKRDLYERGTGNLIDLGSGKTSKYGKQYKRVLAIEPSLDNISKMMTRLNGEGSVVDSTTDLDIILPLMKLTGQKILILVTGGENYELIETVRERFFEGEKADTISAMFSLTFFWQSELMLKAMEYTITQNLAPNGLFLYMVMDGNSVNDLFNSVWPSSSAPLNNTITTELYTIEYSGPQKGDELHILLTDIKETIVGERGKPQIEYVSYIDELLEDSFEDFSIRKLDEELLMNEKERYLSKLFIYGIMKKPRQSLEPLPILIEEEIEEEIEEAEIKEPKELIEDFEEQSILLSTEELEEPGEQPITLPEEEKQLEELEVELLGGKMMEEIRVETIAVKQEERIGQKVLPVVLQTGENTVIDEEWYSRIGVRFGQYGGFYDAILSAFYPNYANGTLENREHISNLMGDKYGEPNLQTLSRVLKFGIILLSVGGGDKLFIIDQKLINNRPVIVIAQVNYNGVLYYELMAEKKGQLYRPIFAKETDFIIKVLSLSRFVTTEYINRLISVGDTSKKFVVYKFNLVEPVKLTQEFNITDKTQYDGVLSIMNKYEELLNNYALQLPKRENRATQVLEIVDNENISFDALLEIGGYEFSLSIGENLQRYVVDVYEDIEDLIKINSENEKIETPDSVDLVVVFLNGITEIDKIRETLFGITNAIDNLSAGGSLIMELNGVYSDLFQSIMYCLVHIFKIVNIVKPSGDIGLYIVCKSLKDNDITRNVVKLLGKVIANVSEDLIPSSVVPIAWILKDKLFLETMRSTLKLLYENEREFIEQLSARLVK